MKGVSAVIATVLMLLITIALAGTAYLYITGVFTARTGVVLSIDGTSSTCTSGGGNITVFLRNDGTSVASSLTTLSFTNPSGSSVALTCQNPTLAALTIPAGTTVSISCSRSGSLTGLYGISASSGGSTTSGTIYCAS